MSTDFSKATGVALRPPKSAAPRQRRRLSAPPVPSQLPEFRFRLHHSTDAPVVTTVDALDLSSAHPTQTLASLRWLVLTYLEGLERGLLRMANSASTSSSNLPSAPTLDDACQWARTALDMLGNIRSEVVSHFPTLNLQLPSTDSACTDVLSYVRTYLPDFELPQLPEWPQMPQLIDEDTLDDATARFHDIDLEFHPKYIETLSQHLTSLKEHLASFSVPLPASPFALPSTADYPLSSLSFASVAESLEMVVNQVQSKLAEASSDDSLQVPVKPRRMSIVSRGEEFIADVCDGFEANVEAMREQQEEMMASIGEELGHMREGFDHMKEGFQENLSHMRDNINHELDAIGHGLAAIKQELGHELDVLKDELEEVAMEIKRAVQRSFHGVNLITYHDLPKDWKNNPFVTTGYRFIPIERWGLLLRSVFECHNETLNIHTHLIPFAIWFSNLVFFNLSPSNALKLASHISNLPIVNTITSYATTAFSIIYSYYSAATASMPYPPFPLAITPVIRARSEALAQQTSLEDPIELAFMAFALLCLFASAVWHTMNGCADKKSMEFCARCDYIGIGWLISASVATVAYYGFSECHPNISAAFLGLCFCTGLAGNIFPFMKWFNMHEYRMYRVAFFLTLAFSGLAPMGILAYFHSAREMYDFVSVIFPSLLSYLIGLFFYAAHVPERWLPPNIRRKLDIVGGSSHAIWHCFIVLAVSQHRAAIQLMKLGIQCKA